MLQLGARYYWPELGRFVQQDPSGSGMNWYAYVGNNPVVYIDPEGLWGCGLGVAGSAESGIVVGSVWPGGLMGMALGSGTTGATGTGLFWGGGGGTQVGAFADTGSFLGTARFGPAFPKTGAVHAVAGGFAGIGMNIWMTNANSPSDLAGPFHNVNVNIGGLLPVPPSLQFSLQVAWANNGLFMVTVGPPGLGIGVGASVSTYDTCAWVVP